MQLPQQSAIRWALVQWQWTAATQGATTHHPVAYLPTVALCAKATQRVHEGYPAQCVQCHGNRQYAPRASSLQAAESTHRSSPASCSRCTRACFFLATCPWAAASLLALAMICT